MLRKGNWLCSWVIEVSGSDRHAVLLPGPLILLPRFARSSSTLKMGKGSAARELNFNAVQSIVIAMSMVDATVIDVINACRVR
jgi:hypothetical protein